MAKRFYLREEASGVWFGFYDSEGKEMMPAFFANAKLRVFNRTYNSFATGDPETVSEVEVYRPGNEFSVFSAERSLCNIFTFQLGLDEVVPMSTETETIEAEGPSREEIEAARENGTLDETCSCGHLKSEHGDTRGGMAKGHGACGVTTCGCAKFTWTGFVIKEK